MKKPNKTGIKHIKIHPLKISHQWKHNSPRWQTGPTGPSQSSVFVPSCSDKEISGKCMYRVRIERHRRPRPFRLRPHCSCTSWFRTGYLRGILLLFNFLLFKFFWNVFYVNFIWKRVLANTGWGHNYIHTGFVFLCARSAWKFLLL